MHIQDILALDRVLLDREGTIRTKMTALETLGVMLGPAVGENAVNIVDLLARREELQSTGIGDGVAIPHASLEAAKKQTAAILICPDGLDFDAIDRAPVTIIVGIVGPKNATGEHLRVLARVSRLLGHRETRQRLVQSSNAEEVFRIVVERDKLEEPLRTVERT